MRRAPSFQRRIFPLRSLPMIEYSVDAERTLAMKSMASRASRITELSKSVDLGSRCLFVIEHFHGEKTFRAHADDPRVRGFQRVSTGRGASEPLRPPWSEKWTGKTELPPTIERRRPARNPGVP